MTLLNLVFGTRSDVAAKIGRFEMDVTIDEFHDKSVRATENPIEDGSIISDHVILDPDRVTINGFITDAPIVPIAGLIDIVSGGGYKRVTDAFEKLEELMLEREPVTLVTGYKTYQDMLITRIQIPRNREIGMRFTCELKALKRVSSSFEVIGRQIQSTVDVSNPSEDAADRASKTSDKGKQVGEAATADGPNAEVEKKSSTAVDIWDGLKKAGSGIGDALKGFP